MAGLQIIPRRPTYSRDKTMNTSPSGRPARRLAMLMNAILAAACISLAATPSLAGNEPKRPTQSRAENKPDTPHIREKVKMTGSAYVCLPSGFGRMGRCVLRRPAF